LTSLFNQGITTLLTYWPINSLIKCLSVRLPLGVELIQSASAFLANIRLTQKPLQGPTLMLQHAVEPQELNRYNNYEELYFMVLVT
jgi:hypothetical protein